MISTLSFQQRIKLASQPKVIQILHLMADKQSNLCLSLDCTHTEEVLTLADQLGPYVAMVKTHVDILEDFSLSFIRVLKELAKKHQFLIFEDRKFADIGNTVRLQFEKGIYHIAQWADLVNAHALPGPGVIEGLKKGINKDNKSGLLLLAQMSSQNNLFTDDYAQKTLEMARAYPDFVCGFIAQRRLENQNPNLLYLTPGVHLEKTGDNLGQQYRTPGEAILRDGCDIIIVGRGVVNASCPKTSALLYKEAGWHAWLARLA